jgi:ABC-type phosphate transport system substrate-binding protein
MNDMRLSGKFGRVIIRLAAALVPIGCGGESRGVVVIDGSSSVFRISNAAEEEYRQIHPEVDVVVDNHGTGGGFGRYLQGEVDIVDASRPARPDEEARAKAQGIEWTRFVVGYDGIDETGTPLAQPLYIYVKNSALRRPEVAAFVKYYIGNAGRLAENARYMAPTAEDLAANQDALAASVGSIAGETVSK